MESNCPKCGAKQRGKPYIIGDYKVIYWRCYSKSVDGEFAQSSECELAETRTAELRNQLAAANSEVERLSKENAELQARYATLANEASNASLHNAFE